MPMTAAELAAYRSGPALVAYLGQRDATASVCDLRERGPHLPAVNDEIRAKLVEGLGEGKIEGELWRRCAAALLRSAPGRDAARLIDAIGHDYRALLKSSDFEKLPALQDRVRVMQQLYIERDNGLDGTPDVTGERFDDLRQALAAHRLGPAATALGEELIATVDLEHGQWAGARRVDLGAVDALFSTKRREELSAASPTASPAPRPARRGAAPHPPHPHRGLPFPEVRDHAAAVEEIVMKQGAYALSLTEHAPTRGFLEVDKIPWRGVLGPAREPLSQTAKLLGYSGDRPGVSVLPGARAARRADDRARGHLPPRHPLRPPPGPRPHPLPRPREDVKLENAVAHLGQGRRVPLRRQHHHAIRALDSDPDGTPLLTSPYQARRRPPPPLSPVAALGTSAPRICSSPAPAPAPTVPRSRSSPTAAIRSASSTPSTSERDAYLAVVERPDAPVFHIISRGAQGFAGAQGSTGSPGSMGSLVPGAAGWAAPAAPAAPPRRGPAATAGPSRSSSRAATRLAPTRSPCSRRPCSAWAGPGRGRRARRIRGARRIPGGEWAAGADAHRLQRDHGHRRSRGARRGRPGRADPRGPRAARARRGTRGRSRSAWR